MNDPSTRKPIPTGKLVLGGVVLAVLIALVFVVRARRLPVMTREQYEGQRAKWEELSVTDYDVTVVVSGMQPGTYDVEVRNGIAIASKFDGRDLTRPRTFGTWAVSGMFHTLAQDLETNDKHGYLKLGAEFHQDFGIPMKYQRIEMRTGAHDALSWEVTKFAPLK